MKKIGIIGAMKTEVKTLKKAMKVSRVVERASMSFAEGTIDGADVVVVKSGVGKVNAGICVQILADEFNVSHIVNTGVAGSLDASLDIGDMVLSSDTVYWDVDARIFGYGFGEVPQLGTRIFAADEDMIKIMKKACERVNPGIRVHEGRIASGDSFVADDEKKAFIAENTQAICCEMEGCAVAHACFLNQIPFVIVRAISDKADGSVRIKYPVFEAKAAKDAARLVLEAVRQAAFISE